MTTESLVQTACPMISTLGGAGYFRPETGARGKRHGLNGFVSPAYAAVDDAGGEALGRAT